MEFFTSLIASGLILLAAALLAALFGPGYRRQSDHQAMEAYADGAEAPLTGLAELPPALARYRELSRPGAPPPARLAQIWAQAEMRFSPQSPEWKPVEVEQVIAATPPCFYWSARMAITGLVTICATDEYRNGRGGLVARLFGAVPMMRLSGSGPLARAQLLRWLAETPLLPEALFQRGLCEFTSLGDDRVEVEINHLGVRARGEFRFGPDGLPASFTALRPRLEQGQLLEDRWEVRYSGWQRESGRLVPTRGQAGWLPAEGEFTYYRYAVSQIRYS